MIKVKQRGDFSKTITFLKRAKSASYGKLLRKYGELGVKSLSESTPFDTGTTAHSWEYKITKDKNRIKISFINTNIQNGIPIAIILQYGHATKNGGWVEGRDYINPSIQPIFDQLAEEAWREVIKP